ncbi:MAG TPA: acylphosphatase [Candidatus Limnocylindrales bacterium]|jgi:acylphosphatase|nr:acylphosphatase [Candidatus Limnocylindrales bacterium]
MEPDADRRPAPADTPADALRRLDATTRGRVQGVGFRYFVLRRAMDLGVVGWVANTPDGVRCVAEGPMWALEDLLSSLTEGPAGALVERVLPTWSSATGRFTSFEIRSGAHPGD